MSIAPLQQEIGRSNHCCDCTGPCPGYDSRPDCPPLIVLAIKAAAMQIALAPQRLQ
jgi:hypothetical protein